MIWLGGIGLFGFSPPFIIRYYMWVGGDDDESCRDTRTTPFFSHLPLHCLGSGYGCPSHVLRWRSPKVSSNWRALDVDVDVW